MIVIPDHRASRSHNHLILVCQLYYCPGELFEPLLGINIAWKSDNIEFPGRQDPNVPSSIHIGEEQGKLVTAERASDFTLRSCGEYRAKEQDDRQRLKDVLVSSRAKETGQYNEEVGLSVQRSVTST